MRKDLCTGASSVSVKDPFSDPLWLLKTIYDQIQFPYLKTLWPPLEGFQKPMEIMKVRPLQTLE